MTAKPGGEVGGGHSHINRTGMLIENLEKKVPRSCFLGVALIFSPLRGADSKSTQ